MLSHLTSLLVRIVCRNYSNCQVLERERGHMTHRGESILYVTVLSHIELQVPQCSVLTEPMIL